MLVRGDALDADVVEVTRGEKVPITAEYEALIRAAGQWEVTTVPQAVLDAVPWADPGTIASMATVDTMASPTVAKRKGKP